MFAEPAQQERLLELAELDAGVARLRHQAHTLPQHAQIKELMAAKQRAADSFIEARTTADDLTEATRRSEADLVPVRARLERNQTRINDGSITDPKTLRGLLEETDHLKNRIDELETAQLELMSQLEAATALRERLRETGQQIVKDLKAAEQERDAQAAELSAQAKQLFAQRQALAKTLPADLVGLYEKIRGTKGSGAAALQRGRCMGCQLEIPVSDLDAYRKAPINQVLRCSECDRIVVRTEGSGL